MDSFARATANGLPVPCAVSAVYPIIDGAMAIHFANAKRMASGVEKMVAVKVMHFFHSPWIENVSFSRNSLCAIEKK